MPPQKPTINLKALTQVEQTLSIQLPNFLWDFYRTEAALIQQLRTISKDLDCIHLTTDFEWMIHHNRDNLKLPTQEGICRNKICIGTDGCGNDSFISLSETDQRVYFIDHEIASELIDESTNDFRWEEEELEKFDSLKTYVQYQIRMYEEL